MEQFLQESAHWLWPLIILFAAFVAGSFAVFVTFRILGRIARGTDNDLDDRLITRGRRPARIIVPLLALLIALPAAGLSPEFSSLVRRCTVVGLIAGVGWLILAGVNVTAETIISRLDVTKSDNLTARRMQTRVQVIRRVCGVIVIFLSGAAILMSLPGMREVGLSLFASAGVAGIVVGLAARPTLSNLLAGLQIALTDPVRLDDVVIVEGEWGRVEEITTTYVVVRIWDMRRLIVPLSQFIEKPFQNWTRQTAEILGTVYIYADYATPVETVRQELHRILSDNKLWDGKVWGLQVTNATDRTLEMRALMSAADSSHAWDLRCHVREKLIAFLQDRYPDVLPRTRAEITTRDTNDDRSRPQAA